MPIGNLLRTSGIAFVVKRSGEEDRTEVGMYNRETQTGRPYVGFEPKADVKVEDVLINPNGETVFVVDVQTSYFLGKPNTLCAYYQTESEHFAAKKESGTVFNIQNAHGSIIGNYNQGTINYNTVVDDLKGRVASDSSPDREDMERIVALLEMIVNNQVPPSKGLFSKFSGVLQRHSWLSSSVSAAIFGWLMTQIP